MLNKDGVFVLLCLMRNIWFLKFAFMCQIWIKLARIHLLKGLLYLSAWDRWCKVPFRFIVYVCILGLVKIMIWTGIVWNICMRFGESARWADLTIRFVLKTNSMSARNVLKFKHPSYDAILRITLYRNLPAWPRNEEVLVAFQWF